MEILIRLQQKYGLQTAYFLRFWIICWHSKSVTGDKNSEFVLNLICPLTAFTPQNTMFIIQIHK